MVEPVQKTMTQAEYLTWEQRQTERHEYVIGFVYAMAGGSRRHNRIALNIASFCLTNAPEHCRIYQEGMKLQTDSAFYYPDVMAVCEPEPDKDFFETSPCLLVEVPSPGTKDIDLREKLLTYQSLPSLETYLVVDTDAHFVRHFWRNEKGVWQQQDSTDTGDISLACLGTTLSMTQIYQNVF